MIKRFTVLFLTFLILQNISAQFGDPVLYEKEIFRNKDIFFNRKLINPTLITNQEKLHINTGIRYSYNQGFNDYNLSTEFTAMKIKSSFGITGDITSYYSNVNNKYSTLRFSYAFFKQLSNNSEFGIGINLGISEYHISDPQPTFNDASNNKETTPFYQFGLLYKLTKHTIGLSYKINESKHSDANLDFSYMPKMLAIHYSYDYNISDNFSFSPEIIGEINSNSTKGIAIIKLNYASKTKAGLYL